MPRIERGASVVARELPVGIHSTRSLEGRILKTRADVQSMGVSVGTEKCQAVTHMLFHRNLQGIVIGIATVGLLTSAAPNIPRVGVVIRVVEGQIRSSLTGYARGVG